MSYWAINKAAQGEILEKLLSGDMVWRIKKERRRGRLLDPKMINAIQKKSKAIVYFSYQPGKGAFYGFGTFFRKIEEEDSYLLEFRKRNGQRGFDRFIVPVEFDSIADDITWRRVQGSIHRISEDDYNTIVLRATKEYARQEAKLEKQSADDPPLKEPQHLSQFLRKIRSSSFRTTVRKDYGYSCAVCKKRRYTRHDNPEVESAHIYPLERDGSNSYRNGIALCKLHHWAFEHGLFSLADDYTIIVEKRIKGNHDYEEINCFENKKIQLPKQYPPHPKFLREHRRMHGFKL